MTIWRFGLIANPAKAASLLRKIILLIFLVSQIITTENSKRNNAINKSNQEFDSFYQDFKRDHTTLGENYLDLQNALNKTTEGKTNPVDFYNYLKSTQNVFLLGWSDLDKKTAPNGLNDAQKKEVNESISITA
ncbi:hypothetical protein Ga0466249_001235 [Sporomusaceae bacterium BoRhaA]|uniref:hypothetical protein n=1 Tax=Pelorhabdus rhamnosifermentans TaxID=2772457 RepID=UPI001C060D5F|nr:hypothetical protein [Pelorhabdus rhamnosifermentans]MBU2700143.1 hypothetical protein [Pelorhabdus rhamnosifermentans]